jgi:hypothetical protein
MAFQLPDSINNESIPKLVRETLDIEVREYYEDRMRICKLDALTKAEAYVDSLFVNKIELTLMKGKKFPQRPVKPEYPREIKLNDTIKIRPLFVK